MQTREDNSLMVHANEHTITVFLNSYNVSSLAKNTATSIATINSSYAPSHIAIAIGHYSTSTVTVLIESDGKITVYNGSANVLSNAKITTAISYIRK